MLETMALVLLFTGAVIGGIGSCLMTTLVLFPIKMSKWLEQTTTDEDEHGNNVLDYR